MIEIAAALRLNLLSLFLRIRSATVISLTLHKLRYTTNSLSTTGHRRLPGEEKRNHIPISKIPGRPLYENSSFAQEYTIALEYLPSVCKIQIEIET